MQIPAIPQATSPVTPVSPAPSTTPNGAFSKALDQAAQRRAEDKPKAKDPQETKESKPASSEEAESRADDDALETDSGKADQTDAAPIDPRLVAAMPTRAELPPIASTADAGAEAGEFARQLGLAVPTSAPSLAPPVAARNAPSNDPATTTSQVPLNDAAADITGQVPTEPTAQITPVLRDTAVAAPIATFAAPGSHATAAATPQTAASVTAEAHVQPRLDSPNFGAAFGAQLSIMAREGVKEARLHLNPAEMGPVTVQITVTGQIARVDMAAEAALTRQVLEQSMPSLAGALRESGLTLAGGGVFEQPRQPGQEDAARGHGRTANGTGTGDADESDLLAAASEQAMARAGARGVVDLYA